MTQLSKKKALALSSIQTLDDVEYIEASYKNDGDIQYIDTGYYVNWDRDFTFKITTNKSNAKRSILVGSFSCTNSFNIEWTASREPRFYIGMSREDYALPAVPSGLIVVIEVSWRSTSQELTISAKSLDGVTYNESYTYTMTYTRSGTITNSLWLFSDIYRTTGTPSTDFNGTQRIYQVEWYEDSLLKARYVPKCRNNVAFFYEEVSKTCLYNGSSTQMKFGSKVREVEYIEFDGTQYFDTGFNPEVLSTTYKTGIAPTAIPGFLFGVRKQTGYEGSCAIYLAGSTSAYPNGYFRLDWVSNTTSIPAGLSALNEYYDIEITGNYAKINGTEYTATTATEYYPTHSFLIGVVWTTSTSGITNPFFIGRFYYGQLLNTNTRELYRDYIPVINEQGIGLLFDRVSHTLLQTAVGTITSYGRRIMPVEYLYGGYPVALNAEIPFGDHIWETDVKVEGDNISLMGSQSGAANYWSTQTAANGYVYTLHTSSSTYDINLDSRERRTVYLNNKPTGENTGTLTMTVDGQSIARSNSSNYNITRGYRLFSSLGNTYPGHSKVYGNRCYDRTTNELLQNLIPMKDENGKGCMLDKVSHKIIDASVNSYKEPIEINDDKTLLGGLSLSKYDYDEVPYGYTKVDYLQSDSAQYFDTGIAGGNDDLEFDIVFSYDTYAEWGAVYGNNTADTDNAVRLLCYPSSGQMCSNHNTRATTSGNEYFNCSLNKIHHLISTKSSIIVDGVTTTRTKLDTGTANTTKICLFNRSITNPATNRNLGLKVYQFKVKNGKTLVGNFIPVIRNLDKKPGMFDTITRKFFVNAGTGEFKYGIVGEYSSLQYLESVGEQYFDTGIYMNSTYGVEIRAKQMDSTTGVARYLFGDAPAADRRYLIVVTNGNDTYRFGLENKNKDTNISAYDDAYHTHKVKDKTYYIDDVSQGSLTVTDFTATRSSRLFNVSTTGSLTQNYWRIDWCRIWDDDNNVIAHFIPVLRNSDSKPGMYDLVRKQFFTNDSGVGEFLYG